MALVYCRECGKQVSSNAVSCPACGEPLKTEQSSSVDYSLLDKRVEEYKKKGYAIDKHEGDSVTMYQRFSAQFFYACAVLLFIIAFWAFIVMGATKENLGVIWLVPLFFAGIGVFFIQIAKKGNRVTIFMTKTGKIEETGSVLKNKETV